MFEYINNKYNVKMFENLKLDLNETKTLNEGVLSNIYKIVDYIRKNWNIIFSKENISMGVNFLKSQNINFPDINIDLNIKNIIRKLDLYIYNKLTSPEKSIREKIMDFKVSLENGIIDKTIINYILGEIFIVLTIVVVNPKEISEVVSKFTPKLIMSLLQLQAFDFINNILGMTNEFSNIITTTHSYVFMVIIFILICIRTLKNTAIIIKKKIY